MRAGRTVERGVAEGEDAAVARDEPVALAGRRRGHADDRLVEPDRAGRAVERGVAVGEDAAVGAEQPVAVAVRRRLDRDDRRLQWDRRGVAAFGRVAEARDTTLPRRRGSNPRCRCPTDRDLLR